MIKTKEDAKKLWPIMKAYSEGKKIQFFNGEEWVDKEILTFVSEPHRYRIKPKTKYRPFKNAEECLEEIQKHQPIGWIKNDKGAYFILSFIDNKTDLEYQFYKYKFVDGEPFGIKEE